MPSYYWIIWLSNGLHRMSQFSKCKASHAIFYKSIYSSMNHPHHLPNMYFHRLNNQIKATTRTTTRNTKKKSTAGFYWHIKNPSEKKGCIIQAQSGTRQLGLAWPSFRRVIAPHSRSPARGLFFFVFIIFFCSGLLVVQSPIQGLSDTPPSLQSLNPPKNQEPRYRKNHPAKNHP